VVFDITERKQATDSLEQQRAFMRQVIDIVPNLIFAKDRAGRFTLANRATADIYGTEPEELIGKTDSDFNSNRDEVEAFRRMDLEVMDSLQEHYIAEERITDARGNVHWLQTVKRPILGTDGKADYILGTSTDITQRKRTEMELQQQRAELAHGARVSMMGALAASIAHELNQPLLAILINAGAGLRLLAADPPDLQEARAALNDIAAANTRASEILRGMRALVRKEKDLEFASLDPADLVRETTALVGIDAAMQDVRIALLLDTDLPAVRGDRIQLQQVVMNILMNALDAVKTNPPGERLAEVRVRTREDGMVEIAVSDRGPGIGDEIGNLVFQPFYTTKQEGLGIGLSICHSIVEAHGGVIRAENNPQGGATFSFTVPPEKGLSADRS
jgi:PAS domain S-box-containing protein